MAPDGVRDLRPDVRVGAGPGHARSGDAIAIGSYLGAGDRFDEAMCRFASSYADQNEKDHEALKLAIATNKVHAISDV